MTQVHVLNQLFGLTSVFDWSCHAGVGILGFDEATNLELLAVTFPHNNRFSKVLWVNLYDVLITTDGVLTCKFHGILQALPRNHELLLHTLYLGLNRVRLRLVDEFAEHLLLSPP